MKVPGRTVEWHASLDTTMRRAGELAEAGCISGTIVGADEQTAGLGRHGHIWHSPTGAGLYFTVVLRMPLSPQQLPVVTLALGLAVADGVRLVSGVGCDLRWPNDVMVDERKLAGILTQYQDGAVLAGIGINVNHAEFPDELKAIATSLRLETGREQNREALLRAVASAVDTYTGMLARQGVESVLRLFGAASSYVRGRRVEVDDPAGLLTGTTAGLTPEGFLKLAREDGSEVIIHAGGVRPLPE